MGDESGAVWLFVIALIAFSTYRSGRKGGKSKGGSQPGFAREDHDSGGRPGGPPGMNRPGGR